MDISIPKIEEKIIKFWRDRNIFERSIQARLGKKAFVFFEGPPTANGRPGIHHLIGRVFKDLIPRYKTMRGYYVARKAGWDTHGLPVEIEVEKELGLTNKKEIEKYGIAKFNARAKKSVWKYKEEWQKFTHRIGFWLDTTKPYITYDPSYIESLWHIIAEINKKKLLYEGHKVLPWCTRCGTALSSHEVAQGYKDVTDTAVFVKFRITNDEFRNTYFLAWTTTPWTLPGNVALAVGADIDYVLTKDGYILAKARVEAVLGKAEIVKEFKGSELVGLKYQPLFDIKKLQNKKAHTVYVADFVTTTDGTGVVHTAVMYGEDDYELGKKIGLPMHHTVAEDGTFTKDVSGFGGVYVKDAENRIIQYLRDNQALLKSESYTHSYPHCWRCKTPLLYYARDSWFVAMSKLRKQLLKNNAKINWVPEHLKEGRFGEFLREVKDWAFSRERYWGTPLPVWKCAEGHQRVIGSYEELEAFRYRPANTYILLRHGESTKNTPDVIQGMLKHDNHHLTPSGIAQVRASIEKIKEEGGIDMIFSSPFLRAKETAQLVGKEFHHSVIVDELLSEVFEGSHWEGKPVKEYLAAHTDSNFQSRDGDGETWEEVMQRMSKFARGIDAKHEGKRILIVSHGDPLWLLKAFLLNTPHEKIQKHFDGTDYPQKGIPESYTLKNFPYDKSGELDPHRPYIDEIALKCDRCQEKMTRVKEVCDVWFDSGAMPYAQHHYPFENQDNFNQNFPADFISEAIDQTRGWFYTLLAVSTALGKKAPYKNVICYNHVLDTKGKKMSKSLGNIVNPWDVIEQYGADAARWYFYSVNNPGDPKLFAIEDVAKVQRGFLTTLLNCLRFYELYEKPGTSHAEHTAKPAEPLDDWILSRLHNTIQTVTTALDAYNPTLASRTLEYFVVEDLSKWWIRRSRDRIAQSPEFLGYLLIETSKLLAPFIPFTAEHIYKQVSNRAESVHLEDWSKAKSKYINAQLEADMAKIREIVAQGLSLRKIANLKVRQPLASLSVKEKLDPTLERYIKDEVNVKEVLFAPSQVDLVTLDTTITPALKIEGYAREISRAIQEMRKEAGYQVGDKVAVFWEATDSNIKKAVAMLGSLEQKRGKGSYDIFREFEISSGVKIWLGIKK